MVSELCGYAKVGLAPTMLPNRTLTADPLRQFIKIVSVDAPEPNKFFVDFVWCDDSHRYKPENKSAEQGS